MHVEKLPGDKGYRAYVSVRGRRRSVTRRTRGEALHAGAELTLELGGVTSASRTTVGEMIAGHLADADWSPSTLTDAHRVVAKLPDTFMRRPVRDVTPEILDGLYRQLTREGWSPHRIRRAHMVMSVAFTQAAVYGWCRHNPCLTAKPPATERPRVRAPEHDEVRAVLDEVDALFAVFMAVAACTGARRGELVALRWPDVHLGTGEVTIARSIVSTVGGTYVERPTKTGAKAHRRLALDEATITALRRWKAEQADHATRVGLEPPEWVFSHDAGVTPWRPDHVSRLFRQACERAGVTGVHFHSIRHYVATSMLTDGEPTIDVAAQLGHASIQTTATTYSHYMPGRGRDSAERRAKRLHHDE